jgi:hypothetical protein
LVATVYAQADSAVATATFHPVGGGSISLSGTYTRSTKTLNLSGSGYTFSGTFASGALTGTYTGPNGVTGSFSSRSAADGTITLYCGTMRNGAGVFNLAVSATGAVSGVFGIDGQFGYISGQVTGTTINITHADASSTGTIQNGTVSGTSTTGNTFSGSTSACQ